MKESKNHIDIDLEFLDKKEPVRVAPKPEPIKKNEPTRRYYESKNDNPNPGKQYNSLFSYKNEPERQILIVKMN